MGHMGSEEWKSVTEAAELVGKTRRQIYRYLDKDPAVTGIRTRIIDRTTYINIPSLQDYEATVKIGRPRKRVASEQKDTRAHGNRDTARP